MTIDLKNYDPALMQGAQVSDSGEVATGNISATGTLTVTGASTLTGAVTATGAVAANGGVTVPTAKTVAATDTVGFTAGGIILPVYELISDNQNQVAAASYAVSHTIFVNDNVSGTYKVVSATATFGTASTSGTLQVEVATGTQAIASGTNQLTGTVSLAGTANTPVNGTIIGSPTTISAGARINLIFAGTVTNLANASVTIALQRLT